MSLALVVHVGYKAFFVGLEKLIHLSPNGLDLVCTDIDVSANWNWKFIETFCSGIVFMLLVESNVLVNRILGFIHNTSEIFHRYSQNFEFAGILVLGNIDQPGFKRFDVGSQICNCRTYAANQGHHRHWSLLHRPEFPHDVRKDAVSRKQHPLPSSFSAIDNTPPTAASTSDLQRLIHAPPSLRSSPPPPPATKSSKRRSFSIHGPPPLCFLTCSWSSLPMSSYGGTVTRCSWTPPSSTIQPAKLQYEPFSDLAELPSQFSSGND
nr:hypothetical protein Iba_chr07eCG11050 [Ipomoea batatas]